MDVVSSFDVLSLNGGVLFGITWIGSPFHGSFAVAKNTRRIATSYVVSSRFQLVTLAALSAMYGCSINCETRSLRESVPSPAIVIALLGAERESRNERR